FRTDFGSPWNSPAYYGGAVYDGYGYALPHPHDPSMYAAAYGAYPIYGGHQQQLKSLDKVELESSSTGSSSPVDYGMFPWLWSRQGQQKSR
ncbi:polyadenylate-binding protein RBP47C-like, partial [Trifolium medium]|nr:polyadenylate-binding protein RBP47C-like [Trifolium medium]